jgi:ABC-2 type transport system permease protein
MLLNYFLSGHMFPLDWLPEPYSTLVQLLPFKYLAYVPAAIILQRYSPTELWLELALEAAWVVALLLLVRWTLARGIRRYSAYGG